MQHSTNDIQVFIGDEERMNIPIQKNKRRLNPALRPACVAMLLAVGILYSGCTHTKELAVAPRRVITGSAMTNIQSGNYTIKAGDMVELSVLGYPEFQVSTTVKESGAIIVPFAGEVHVAGLTKPQLVETMRKKLAEFVKGEPEITIGISSLASERIRVLGAVTRQDNYPVTGEISLVDAIAGAGGTTPESDLSRVYIIHNGKSGELAEVDLASFLEEGNLDANPSVQSGDVIYVPKKENVVRVVSEFLRDVAFLFGAFRLLY